MGPDIIDEGAVMDASGAIACLIMEMQNENPHPEAGTLGFIMGLSLALGNIAAMYVSEGNRQRRKEFLRIVQMMVSDSFKEPFVTGTVTNGVTFQ